MDNAQVTSFIQALMAIEGWSEITMATFRWLLTDAMRARSVEQRLAEVGLCCVRTESFGTAAELAALGQAADEYPNALRVTQAHTVRWLQAKAQSLAPERRRAPAVPPRSRDARTTEMDNTVRRVLGR